jgi:hypothetical protein
VDFSASRNVAWRFPPLVGATNSRWRCRALAVFHRSYGPDRGTCRQWWITLRFTSVRQGRFNVPTLPSMIYFARTEVMTVLLCWPETINTTGISSPERVVAGIRTFT